MTQYRLVLGALLATGILSVPAVAAADSVRITGDDPGSVRITGDAASGGSATDSVRITGGDIFTPPY